MVSRLTAGSWLAILLCAALAVFLSLFLRGDSLRLAVPAMFLLVIITISHVHVIDRLACVVTVAVVCVVFAVVLFEPYGSLVIHKTSDRVALSCFAVAALAVVSLSPRPNRGILARARFYR